MKNRIVPSGLKPRRLTSAGVHSCFGSVAVVTSVRKCHAAAPSELTVYQTIV